MGTLTAHSEYGHYAGHSDQEISFGKPKPLHQEMFEGVQHVRNAVLSKVRDGVTQRELVDAYQAACQESGFRSSPHSQIHQYGVDVPEFPGPAFKVSDPQGGAGLGGGGNFTLRSGMIYSISPTLIANEGADTLLGGTSLVVTADGYRELSDRKVELLVSEIKQIVHDRHPVWAHQERRSGFHFLEGFLGIGGFYCLNKGFLQNGESVRGQPRRCCDDPVRSECCERGIPHLAYGLDVGKRRMPFVRIDPQWTHQPFVNETHLPG